MADTPIFNPPMNRITDKDPMIVKVPMDKVDWAFRQSQQPASMNDMGVVNIPNRT